MITIGIDNGVSSGAIVALDMNGKMIAKSLLPKVKHRTRNELDVMSLYEWLYQTLDGDLNKARYLVEEHGNSRNAMTAGSVSGCFHAIRSMLQIKRCEFKRITPQSWQKAMLGKVAKGQTKVRALEEALKQWELSELLATTRSKVAHPGIVDAALIALYGINHIYND